MPTPPAMRDKAPRGGRSKNFRRKVLRRLDANETRKDLNFREAPLGRFARAKSFRSHKRCAWFPGEHA